MSCPHKKDVGDLTGPLAWSGGGDGTLLVHELLTGQCLYGLGATANGAVRCISLVGPDHLVVAGDDGNVMIYSI
jgi:F-box/WD-40 domain protein 7